MLKSESYSRSEAGMFFPDVLVEAEHKYHVSLLDSRLEKCC